MADESGKKVTFFSRNAITCPICDSDFYKEELFSGGGRLMAGELAHDLRRIYEPSKKFGELFPLIYFMLVCPHCLFSSFPADFLAPEVAKFKPNLEADSMKRRETVNMIFNDLNFTEPRRLTEGAASYFLAIMCYDHFDKKMSPTVKQGVSALRAAWIFNDLHRKAPGENWDYLAKQFYRKASFFYSQALEKEQNGTELLSGLKNLGPDLDKNYGYEGLLYLTGYLEYQYGSKKDIKARVEKLEKLKRVVSKMHGIGKASKDKPSAIINKARDLYEKIGDEITELSKELV